MVDGARPSAREPALPLRPHHAARLSAVAEQPVPHARPQPALAGRVGGRGSTALPPHPGTHVGGRARRAALRGRRSARGAGDLHRESQCPDRDLLRRALPPLLRSSEAGGLASGTRPERDLPRARPRRGRDGARDRRLPRGLRRLPRPGAVAPPSDRVDTERVRARCLGRDLHKLGQFGAQGFRVLSRPRAPARGVRCALSPTARSICWSASGRRSPPISDRSCPVAVSRRSASDSSRS